MLSSTTKTVKSSHGGSNLDFFSKSRTNVTVAARTPAVNVRTVKRPVPIPPKAGAVAPKPKPRQPTTSSATASPSPAPPLKKRKEPDAASALPKQVKRIRTEHGYIKKRVASSSGSRRSSPETSPEPIYRHSSKSRSSSVLPPADDAPPPNQNREWRTEMDGRPGEYNRSSEKVVQAMEKDYKPYFDEFGHYREGYPRIELEYPNNNATEFFVPLYPKDPDHYNPLKDVVDSLHVIIGILDPQLQKLFGTLPEDVFSNLVSPESSPKSSPSSALSSPPSSQGSCNSSLTSLSTPCLSEAAAKALARANGDVLRCIRRALHTENGAMFIEFFEEAMRRMRDIKYPMLPQDIFADPPPNGPR